MVSLLSRGFVVGAIGINGYYSGTAAGRRRRIVRDMFCRRYQQRYAINILVGPAVSIDHRVHLPWHL